MGIIAVSKIHYTQIMVYFIVSIIIFKLAFRKLFSSVLKYDKTGSSFYEYILYTVVITIPLLAAVIAYYPALINGGDTICQWDEVLSNGYDNWHPLIYVLIFFKVPSLFYYGLISCTIFQAIFIVLVLLYLCHVLRKYYLTFGQTILLLILIVMNPETISMSVTLWKDIPYSYCILLGTLISIQMILSDGSWIEKDFNKLLFLSACFGILYFRHNGILAYLLWAFSLLFFFNKHRKTLAKFFLMFTVLWWVITVPVYDYLGIGPNGRRSEMLGIPLNQISYIYNTGGGVSVGQRSIMNKICPIKDWEKYYIPGDFINIRWHTKYGIDYIKNNYSTIMKLWLDLVTRYPKKAIKAYIYTTKMIWQILDDYRFAKSPDRKDITGLSGFDLLSAKCYNLISRYESMASKLPFRLMFFSFGDGLFVILAALCMSISKCRKKIKGYLPYILVLSNVGSIMLLMWGAENEARYVYSSILCSIPLMIYAVSTPPKKSACINSAS